MTLRLPGRGHFAARLPVRAVAPLLALLSATAKAMAADPPPSPPAPTESVLVTSRKLTVQTFIDRKVYTLTDELQADFGTLSNVLADIPSVNVDPDGILTLRGDSHVLILIDGKPSPLFSGSRAGDNLQSFPAANIERIEVITTPSSQYQAAGAAGVINIITRKGHKEGIASSVRASQGNDGRSVVSADSSYRSEKLSVSLDAGFRHDERLKLLESDMRSPLTPAASTLDSTSTLLEHSWRDVPNASANADYELDEKDSVNGSFSWLRTGGPRNYTQTTTTTDTSGTVTSASERLSRGHNPETAYDERLGYVRKLAQKGAELDISLHRATSHQVTRYDNTNDSLLPAAAPYDSYLILNEQDTTTEAALDYVLPLSNTQELKLGSLFEQDDYGFGSTAGDEDLAETIAPAATDDFTYRQRIYAGYASYKASVGKWSFLGGLRLEGTTTDARVPTDDRVSRDHYLGLFPSLHVERSVSDAGTLSFGASRRVTRPDPQQLDPNIDPEYTLILRTGHVHLLPEYTQSYELGYGSQGHDLNYQVTGYYRRNHDSATGVVEYLGDGVSLATQENLPRDDFEGLEVTAAGHLGSPLSYSISGNLFQDQVDASALGLTGLRSTRGVDAKFKLDYRPTAHDLAQLSISRTDSQLTAQGYVSAMHVVNVGYRHQLRADLAALATVSDLFNGQRTQTVVTTPSFAGYFVRAIQGPIIYVGVVYSFGSQATKEPEFQYEH
jgi:outer membrane receptor protein involved in Fe transport